MVLLSTVLSACSPGYVLEAAYTHSKILLSRRDIDTVITTADTPAEERSKLETVVHAREFARSIGLEPGNSFTHYARVDGDVLAWVVVGARPDAFELHTWWFPIVGTVPYKGYFDRADAAAEAARLERRGYETWVRGTEAFSTLGWFNDPVLSTTLRHDHTSIATTVIHESVHSTVWIPDHVAFNESLANFVGVRGALDFARATFPADHDRVVAAHAGLTRELALGSAIVALHSALEELYRSDLDRPTKLARRHDIFEREVAPLRATYPQLRILRSINNAEIMQLKLYLTALPDFAALFAREGEDWRRFIERIRSIKARVESDSTTDPFAVLRELSAPAPLPTREENAA